MGGVRPMGQGPSLQANSQGISESMSQRLGLSNSRREFSAKPALSRIIRTAGLIARGSNPWHNDQRRRAWRHIPPRGPCMAISFSCPQCGKGYKVKDELAGKTVPCKECAEPIRIPPAALVPSIPEPELESLVKAALVEPAATADSGPTEIEFECPNCIEKVKLDAKFAG